MNLQILIFKQKIPVRRERMTRVLSLDTITRYMQRFWDFQVPVLLFSQNVIPQSFRLLTLLSFLCLSFYPTLFYCQILLSSNSSTFRSQGSHPLIFPSEVSLLSQQSTTLLEFGFMTVWTVTEFRRMSCVFYVPYR